MTIKTNPAGSPTRTAASAAPAEKKPVDLGPVQPESVDTITGPAGPNHGVVADSSFAPQRIVAGPVVARAATKIHSITTKAQFDALFAEAPSVTAGAANEIKFLVDRKTKEIFFIPPKWKFHYSFFHDVIDGSMTDARFDQLTYNRPDRRYIAGTLTRYDSYVDPKTGQKGKLCFSLWPTDRFDSKVLAEAHHAARGALKFLPPATELSFRPGGPIQDRLVTEMAPELKAAKIGVTTNLEISKALKFMGLSGGEAVGKLVVIDKGQAPPPLGRGDVALFLGDVPPTAPPVAAIMTAQVQTYNSHLGIKYREDNTPYFYKAFSDAELAELKKLNGKPVKVTASSSSGTVVAATEAQAKAYLDKIRPKDPMRLGPNLTENKALPLSELSKRSLGPDGQWDKAVLAAYGRKTMGLVELMKLKKSGQLEVQGPGEPEVIVPSALIGIPANWYTRFMREAKDPSGQTFSARIKTLTADPKFADVTWRAEQLKTLREDISAATVPASLMKDLSDQVAAPYLKLAPGMTRARFRSSAPVVEDGDGGKLPNMAGAFDSNSAKWKVGATPAATVANAAEGMAQALKLEYASVWNDRATSELDFNRVAMDEASVAMSLAVIPSEQDEKANGVVRVNPDLAGFFSVTGETQYGENLVTNPEGGAAPDTWIDGNYDVFGSGEPRQDIEYERLTNLPVPATDPSRKHAFKDEEISSTYKAMKVIRNHFAKIEGKVPEQYVDECELKITSEGKVLIKQERPWVE